MQQWRTESRAMTFDEASMERSKSFVKALQELKNLRPQLYSAAEYCEKSYLHSDQKQLRKLRNFRIKTLLDNDDLELCVRVLDNLKDYAARALINAVDHIGTVAYKLNDLFEQQTLEASTVETKISCLSQHILVCQNYVGKEGVKQHQMLEASRKYHKHYTLPSSGNIRVEDASKLQTDYHLKDLHAIPHPRTSGTSGSKTLSWHLASEAKSAIAENMEETIRVPDLKARRVNSDFFHLLDEPSTTKPSSSHLQAAKGNSSFDFNSHPPRWSKETMEFPKPMSGSAIRSLDNHRKQQLQVYHHPTGRNRSMLSAFFAKNKMQKSKRIPVSGLSL